MLSGTPGEAGDFPYTLTATNPAGTATTTQQLTINPATTGQVANSAPSASAQPGAWENDTTARIFVERTNQTLTSPLTVGGTTITAGTKVNSYYVHADPVGNVNTAHLYAGTVNFGTKVLAVATSSSDLQATIPRFGVTGTTYSTSPYQGMEYTTARPSPTRPAST